MLVRCMQNHFGNANFTKGKLYEIKPYNKTHVITTNYPECDLICNLENNRATKGEICFGGVGFTVIKY